MLRKKRARRALVQIKASELKEGETFYFNRDMQLPEKIGKVLGYVNRPEVNPLTGEYTGKVVRFMAFSNSWGHRVEIKAEAWVFVER